MKIEKIGEKKEWFLEKLWECYSISNKNGTLSKEVVEDKFNAGYHRIKY